MLNLSPRLMIAEEVWVILPGCHVSHKPASMTLSTLPERRQAEAETGTYIWIRLRSDPGILGVPGSQSELTVSSGALESIPHVCTCLDSGRCIALRMRVFNLPTAEHAQTSS